MSKYVSCASCGDQLYCFESDLIDNPESFWLANKKQRWYFCSIICLNNFVKDNYKYIGEYIVGIDAKT